MAVVQGRLTDRFGQARVLPVGAAGFAVSLGLLMWSVETDRGAAPALVFAFLTGAAMPVVGSAVRARWAYLVPDKSQLQTAFAYEAVMDEVVFMLGPTLVTLLATAVHPLAGLGTAVVAGVVGTFVLAAQRGTEPPRHERSPVRAERPRLPWPTLLPMVVASAALGSLFGSVEVATVAFAEALDARATSGVLLATWAFGSLVSGVATGAVTWRADNATRFRWGLLALAISVVPLPFLDGLALMGAVLFVAGFAISPTLIALMALTEEVVPIARLTEGMSIIHTGMAAGIAPGAALAGLVVDRAGASASYWVSVVSGVVGAAAGFIAAAAAHRRAAGRARAASSPTESSA
jgi:predicted MFS family arabinose efflux permease